VARPVTPIHPPFLVRFLHERIRLRRSDWTRTRLIAILERCLAGQWRHGRLRIRITTICRPHGLTRAPRRLDLLEVGWRAVGRDQRVEKPAMTVNHACELDHQAILGDTIEEMQAEKAGIIKRGVPWRALRASTRLRLDVIEARAMRPMVRLCCLRPTLARVDDRARTGLIFPDRNRPSGPALAQPSGVRTRSRTQHCGLAAPHSFRMPFGSPKHACEAALQTPTWPARMQNGLRQGPLGERGPLRKVWLGTRPQSRRRARDRRHFTGALPKRPDAPGSAMLNTKRHAGVSAPLARGGRDAQPPVSIPDAPRDLVCGAKPADHAHGVGFDRLEAPKCPRRPREHHRQIPYPASLILRVALSRGATFSRTMARPNRGPNPRPAFRANRLAVAAQTQKMPSPSI